MPRPWSFNFEASSSRTLPLTTSTCFESPGCRKSKRPCKRREAIDPHTMKDHILRNYGTPEAANARIHELESRLGIPRSDDIEEITSAWDRLSVLEEIAAVRNPGTSPSPKAGSNTPKAKTSSSPFLTDKPLFGLARAIAANQRKSHV